MKLNLPQEEAEQCVRKVRERQMGYWFENMEKMDIQAERRNTAEARAELEKARKRLEKIKKKADEAEKKADEALTGRIRSNVEICQELGLSKEEIKAELEAEINKYWK